MAGSLRAPPKQAPVPRLQQHQTKGQMIPLLLTLIWGAIIIEIALYVFRLWTLNFGLWTFPPRPIPGSPPATRLSGVASSNNADSAGRAPHCNPAARPAFLTAAAGHAIFTRRSPLCHSSTSKTSRAAKAESVTSNGLIPLNGAARGLDQGRRRTGWRISVGHDNRLVFLPSSLRFSTLNFGLWTLD